ncbi:hypothetical protein [Paenibacillus ehimensis]|uniref:Uncharacterized protein n=1 Tax=Paenibacillus ehimensis TaxID=79264 RepID=A0ABT8VEM5_9BACL|nr:hypothetical protein [Paenibacillus ehimensis]MDO3679436.1 hypothetical protein [Paenibacillus ehimensis]MEC0207433.1 hypothetical protein [Paenibacillus ehimensis]
MKKIASLALLAAFSVVSIVPAANAEQVSSREIYASTPSINSTITASKNMHYEGTFTSISNNLVVKKNMIVDEGRYVTVTAYATYPKDTQLYMQLQKRNGSSWDMVEEDIFTDTKKAHTFSKLKAGTYRVQLWYNGAPGGKITNGTVKLDWVGE